MTLDEKITELAKMAAAGTEGYAMSGKTVVIRRAIIAGIELALSEPVADEEISGIGEKLATYPVTTIGAMFKRIYTIIATERARKVSQ